MSTNNDILQKQQHLDGDLILPDIWPLWWKITHSVLCFAQIVTAVYTFFFLLAMLLTRWSLLSPSTWYNASSIGSSRNAKASNDGNSMNVNASSGGSSRNVNVSTNSSGYTGNNSNGTDMNTSSERQGKRKQLTSQKHKAHRRPASASTYNLHLMFLVIPDALLNASGAITSASMVVNNGRMLSTEYLFFAIWIVMFYFVANFFLNAVVAYEIHNLVIKSYQGIRIKNNSSRDKRRTYFQIASVYIFAILGATWCVVQKPWSLMHVCDSEYGIVQFGSPPANEDGTGGIFPTATTLIIFFSVMAVPTFYVLYVRWSIWRYGLLPKSGRTRVLSMYFMRILVVFFVFYFPNVISNVLRTRFNNIYAWFAMKNIKIVLEVSQAIVTLRVARQKDDIGEAFDTLYYRCQELLSHCCCFCIFCWQDDPEKEGTNLDTKDGWNEEDNENYLKRFSSVERMGRQLSNVMLNVRSILTTGDSTSIKSQQHTQSEIDHADGKIKSINPDNIEENVDYSKAETLFYSQQRKIQMCDEDDIDLEENSFSTLPTSLQVGKINAKWEEDDVYDDNEQVRRTSFQQFNAGRHKSFGGLMQPPLKDLSDAKTVSDDFVVPEEE